MVWAYDEETGENAWKPVVRLFRNQTKEWYHVFVDGEEIVCTAEHPFYVVDKGFVPARVLKTEDKLLLESGKQVAIDKIEIENLAEFENTYNFEVADFHTYYVSESNILVHNKCEPGYDDHHIIPHKNKKYSDGYRDILKDNKLGSFDLQNDRANIISLKNHRGRHTNKYHSFIKKWVERNAVQYQGDIAGFREALKGLGRFLQRHPRMPYWK